MELSNKHLGIIIMNLGTPDSTKVSDIKKYLDEFLMDKKVMDYPYLYRWLLVKKIITPRRSPKSAEAYKSIWWPEGSPLRVISERVRVALEECSGLPVELTMRYGNPTPETAFKKMLDRNPGLQEIFIIPMYPHYAMASYETALDYAVKAYKKHSYPFKLTILQPFYQKEEYIKVLANLIRPYIKPTTDYLLFSFHGVPVRHIKKGDITGRHCLQGPDCCTIDSPAHAYCYRHQVTRSAHLTAKVLGLGKGQYGISFQSRLGRTEWLQPYTSETLKILPGQGFKNIVVTCPAFTTDCLETLEEIAIEGRETFLASGGTTYETTPCLNDDPAWIALLNNWVQDHLYGNPSRVYEEEKA